MLKLEGGTYLDIKIKGKDEPEYTLNYNTTEVLGFRIVYTAGLCLPTVQFILYGTAKSFYELFNEMNTIQVSIGTSPDTLDTFDVQTVGKHIQKGPDLNKYILNWGGVIIKNKLNLSFIESRAESLDKGSALDVLQRVWKEQTGCGIDSDIGTESMEIVRSYKRHNKSLNNYLVDLLLHVDKRPSFPLATIDRDCNLVLRDFQTLKRKGAIATLVPSGSGWITFGNQPDKKIPYVGNPESCSFRVYANRACGYTQLNGRKLNKKESEVASSSFSEDWKINKLSDSLENNRKANEHVSNTIYVSGLTIETPMAFHEIALHNKHQMINMSAIQTKVRVEGRYLKDIKVLDIVRLTTGQKEDRIAGNYIVEAIEQGIVEGSTFTNILWLCRDNDNDVEKTIVDHYQQSVLRALNIDAKTKAKIVNATRASRSGLAKVRNVMDGTLLNSWERYLISLKNGALSNFSVSGATVDFSDRQRAINSAKQAGTNVINRFISMVIKSPYDMFFRNMLTSNVKAFGMFRALLSALMGSELYGAFDDLLSELRFFDTFLDSYSNTVKQIEYKSSPVSVTDVVLGVLTLNPTGSGTDMSGTGILSTSGATAMIKTTTNEEIRENIIKNITENIPDSVDLPIPDIELSDSDVLKPTDILTSEVVDTIVDDLISRGYVYDSGIIDVTGSYGNIVKADGTEITYAEARHTMVPSSTMKEILLGNQIFDATVAKRIEHAIGNDYKVRHWGTFLTEDDLMQYNITRGFVDKYKTINATKSMSVLEGRRVFVALPSSEKGTKFYINYDRVNMNEMDTTLGYVDAKGKIIPYTIYYTTEGYNSSNLILEMRKGN